MSVPVTTTKPPYGAPCNGCGQCCREQLCPLGARMFGTWNGPCPAFIGGDGSGFCGLVATPREFAPVRTARYGVEVMSRAALHLIGAGLGCDARKDDEPDNPLARMRMIAAAEAQSMYASMMARKVWGIDAGGRRTRGLAPRAPT